jgi:hypothetical protein
VRAWAKASSLRRRDKLEYLHQLARAQVSALKRELTEDAGASARRKQAAQERAVREREQRLAQAIATMDEIAKMPPPKVPKPSKRRGRRSGDDDPPAGGQAAGAAEDKPNTKDAGPRISPTDPHARVMKMADGGFRPALNAQLAVDAQTQLIAAVEVVNSGSDSHQMAPMHAQVQQRYGLTPAHWLADGGYTKFDAIEQLMQHGTQPIVPPHRGRTGKVEPLTVKASDSPDIAHWRRTMASDHAKQLYVQRGASVECANAHLRRRGLTQFNVRGMVKAKAVLLWHALAHNLMRLRAMNIAFA